MRLPPAPSATPVGRLTLLVLAVAAAAAGACGGSRAGGTAPGPGSTSFGWAGLRLEVHLVSSPPDRIRARGDLVNEEDAFLSRQVPHCVLQLRVYRGERRVWSHGEEGGCFGYRTVRLAPGESESYHATVPARRVLGDSLPSGEYLVRAYWPSTSRPGPMRSEIEVTLGVVTLERD